MKNYLSFGGGVNSVAMYLYMLDEGMEFEAVFVDHGTDWPETYEYVEMFKQLYPLTVLKPDVQGFSNLYEYSWHYRMVPSFIRRWCTAKFKIRVMEKYYKTPCFVCIGFDAGEAHRAKLSASKGAENRFPLIEAEIDRDGCKKLIKRHGLPVPMKSGCYICPFQRVGQWKGLRVKHTDLFCKAQQLEKRNLTYRAGRGKSPMYIMKKPLSEVVNERQVKLWKEDEYPPCHCRL
ncbi:MAG TPA: hypothetical protein ENI07_13335 [Desulfobacterales bacterium]|nr:hypothetical protein [Desulfobacterales bacterium]